MGRATPTFNRGASNDRDLTVLLRAWQDGDRDAGEAFFEQVYPELRRIAARQLGVGGSFTCQPTEVVHEAYIKLVQAGSMAWPNRLAFFALAAQIVRQVLVDRARNRRAAKRGGNEGHVDLEVDRLSTPEAAFDLLDLDEALSRLADENEEAARVVVLRYFGGLTIAEIAQVAQVGTATVSRRWSMARAWLRRALDKSEDERRPRAGRVRRASREKAALPGRAAGP